MTKTPTHPAPAALTDLPIARHVTRDDVGALFDTLSPATLNFMIGLWRTVVVPSPSPNQQVLIDSGYFGMQFTDPETVDPLLFHTADGAGVFAANPIKLFSALRAGACDVPAVQADVEIACPAARLRMIEYRGVVSAALIYDSQPVLDHFRTVTDDTVLGAVEARGYQHPTYFALQRCGEATR